VTRVNVKRSFAIARHRTSVALEPEFWAVLENMAASRSVTLPQLIARIDAGRDRSQPLSSALRVAALHAASTQK
jgi:predicted DNA-binding ribbon-helix-helix protein